MCELHCFALCVWCTRTGMVVTTLATCAFPAYNPICNGTQPQISRAEKEVMTNPKQPGLLTPAAWGKGPASSTGFVPSHTWFSPRFQLESLQTCKQVSSLQKLSIGFRTVLLASNVPHRFPSRLLTPRSLRPFCTRRHAQAH